MSFSIYGLINQHMIQIVLFIYLFKFMCMNELLRDRLIILLSEPTQVTNEEIQNAYGCFMKQVKVVSQSENDYSEIFRTLNVTRIELLFIESRYRYEQGEKCPKINLFAKDFTAN